MHYGVKHERFVELFGKYRGQEFSGTEIRDIVSKKYQRARSGIIPSDHDTNRNIGECKCVAAGEPIFERLGHNLYRVR
jgi:hypothetical protein